MLYKYRVKKKTQKEVVRVFDGIEAKIGYLIFKKLFSWLLLDRGSEFLKVNEICYSIEKLRKRTKIFYCDSESPTQKSNIENIYLMLRRVYLKGKSLKKKKYKEETPNEMIIEHYRLTLLKKLSFVLHPKSWTQDWRCSFFYE